MSTARIIKLPMVPDYRGNLSFLQNHDQLPFDIRRVHWIYDVPGGESRGGVAYKETEEFIIALSGSFDVLVDDGREAKSYHLNRSYYGVYVPAGTWRKIDNFSTNSLAAIATSTHYNEADAIRDYETFLQYTQGNADDCNANVSQSVNNSDDSISAETSNAAAESGTNAKPVAPAVNAKPACELTKTFSVDDCCIIELDRHHSARKGDICVVENGETVPFDVKRMYYLYDVPADAVRGGHAHKHLYQLLVAAGGSFTVLLDDGRSKRSVTLKRPYQGLLIKPGIWREVEDFSSGSVCMVLASELYDEADYIRRYQAFLEYKQL